MVFKKHPLLILFSLGLILRLCLIFLDFSFDVNSFITWGRDAFVLGFRGFYERPSSAVFANVYPNYPPLAVYLFYLSHGLYTLVKTLVWQLNVSFPVFPSQLVFFFNSAYWGQTEAISIFFLLLSFYFLLFSKKAVVVPILFTLALLSKQSAIVFVPVFLLLYFLKFKMNVVKGVLISLIIFWISFFPFYKSGDILLFPFTTYFKRVLGASGLPFISNHAFNFWALISQWKNIPDTIYLLGVRYQFWGYLLTGFFIVFILKILVKRKFSSSNILLAIGLTAFAAFLFLTKIHERHFEQVLPFLIPAALQDKHIMKVFVALSFVHFLNLYHNWPVPKVDVLISFVHNPLVVNFFIVTFLGLFFYLFRYYFNRRSRA